MKILAIDTSHEDCAVAVTADAGTGAVTLVETIGRGHAERLPLMIEAAIGQSGLALADIERIAVTIGPGSFTGLRVGIAAARGLALVLGCELVGIGVLDALAEAARRMAGPVPVLALLDARRDELYGAAFDAGGAPLGPPEAGSPEHFAVMAGEEYVLAGSGSDLCAANRIVPPSVIHRYAAPPIGAVLALALRVRASDTPPSPLYLRAPDARPQQGKGVPRR